MKKLALINSVCGFSSTGRITLDIAQLAEKQGFSPYVFYGLRKTAYKNAVRFNTDLDVKLHVLKTRLLGKHAFYSKGATKRLIKRLISFNPDVILLGQVHGHYINIPVLFSYLAESNVPVIWTLHDCWAMTGHCAHFNYVKCDKWKTGCSHCPQLREYPISLIFDRSRESWRDKKYYFQLPKNMKIVCPSDWLAELAGESFLNVHPITRIYNSVDTTIFKPRGNIKSRKKYGISEDKFIILGMANKWFDKRNFEKSQYIINNLNDDMVICLIGAQKKYIKFFNNRVVPISYINDIQDLADAYSMCDVFVNLSYEDSFGNVNAEAMACGTPVIGYDATAIPEVVGDCGVILETASTGENILDAIHTLRLADINALSKKGVTRVNKFFGNKKNYQQYIDLFMKA